MSEPIDIGHGHTIQFIEHDGVKVGVQINHTDKSGSPCACSAFWAGRKTPIWTATSLEPLTLSPSIRCLATDCNDHGFISEGRWVPAP